MFNTSIAAQLPYYISQTGKSVKLPDEKFNYARFDDDRANKVVLHNKKALPYLNEILKISKNENQILETLYIMNKIADKYPKDVALSYGYLSRFNTTQNPNIQVMLAGIYRKTMVPDGFGPLLRMLEQHTKNPSFKYFDPTEEIGGAILEYLKNYSSSSIYTWRGFNNSHTS